MSKPSGILGRDGLPISKIKIHRKQAEVLAAKERFIVCPWGRRALSLDTPIPTPQGWTTMGDIRVGDSIFDETGKASTVVSATEAMIGHKCYRVGFSDGTYIDADAGHLWETWDFSARKAYDYDRLGSEPFPGDRFKWRSRAKGADRYSLDERRRIASMKESGSSCSEIGAAIGRTADAISQQWNKASFRKNKVHGPAARTTKEISQTLRRGLAWNHVIPTCEPLSLPEVELPIDAWVLGYLLGNADSTGSGRVACHPRDRDWLMAEFSRRGVDVSLHKDAGHFGVPGLRVIWRTLGLFNNKHIPALYMRSSIDQRRQLLAGLIDSDGHVDSHGSYRFTNTNESLISGAVELAASLGLVSHVFRRQRSRNGSPSLPSADVGISSSMKLSLMPRKLSLARHAWKREQCSKSIVSCEEIVSVPVRCITVSNESSLFLAGRGMVPTHNSGKSELGVLWTLMQAQRYRAMGVKGVAWLIFPAYLHSVSAWRKIHRMAPEGWITSISGNENLPGHITFGSVRIEFRSAAKPEKLVSEGLLFAWIDECGIIKERTWGESIRPTLMDRAAPAFFSGSPKGNNWYRELYVQGWSKDPKNDHIKSFGINEKFGFSSHINPFIVQSELALIAADMTERTYRQEIMAEFLTGEGAVFRRIREQIMSDANKSTWLNSKNEMCQGWGGKLGKTIILGIDLARFQDWSVIIGMDKDFRVTYFDRFNQIDYPLQKARIKAAYHKLGKPTIVIDSTHGSVGDPIQQDLVHDGIRAHPFEFTGVSKGPLVEELVLGVEQGKVWLPDEPVLINELEMFDGHMRPSGKMLYNAPSGKHDDCVFGLCLAYWGAKRFGDSGITFAR